MDTTAPIADTSEMKEAVVELAQAVVIVVTAHVTALGIIAGTKFAYRKVQARKALKSETIPTENEN